MTEPFSRPRQREAVIDRRYEHARLANALLGLWLFTSTFLWPHFDGSRTNTWVVGVLIFSSAVAALRASMLRWANTALSAWLFGSTLLIFRPLEVATLWNNSLVAAAVFAFSLVARGGNAAPRMPSLLRSGRRP